MKTELAISIAAYNDAVTLEPLVRESLAVLDRITPDHQVFVINDGSRDRTSAVLAKLSRELPRVMVHEHPENRGFGPTIREVYTLPESTWVFFIPGDGQIPPAEILKLHPHTGRSAFILGYRKSRRDPFMRRVNSWCYNWAISCLAGRRIHDVNSVGLLRKEVLADSTFLSTSAFIHAEILLEVLRKKMPFSEVEIEHRPRTHGKGSGSRWRVIRATVRDMLRFFMRRLRSRIA